VADHHGEWIGRMRAQLRRADGPEFHPPFHPPPAASAAPPGNAHDFGYHDLCGPDCTDRPQPPEEPD